MRILLRILVPRNNVSSYDHQLLTYISPHFPSHQVKRLMTSVPKPVLPFRRNFHKYGQNPAIFQKCHFCCGQQVRLQFLIQQLNDMQESSMGRI